MGWRKAALSPVVLGLLLALLLAAPTAAQAAQGYTQEANKQCLGCHGNEGLVITKDGAQVSLFVDAEAFAESVHGNNTCTSCHQGVKLPHDGTAPPDRADLGVSSCATCHQGPVAESYAESFHGKAVSLGASKPATCADCHGSHTILAQDNPKSSVYHANVPQTCAKCHGTAQVNFAAGKEHFELEPTGSGAPMYYTAKFFTWLTIIAIVLLIIHIELELLRDLLNLNAASGRRK